MSIPNDPLNRWWFEGASQTLVDGLRPSLVAFLAFDYGHVPSLAGSGFLIGGARDQSLSLALTAKHVLTEGVVNIQRPVPRHAPSALFVPTSSTTPSVKATRLRAVWMGSESSDLLHTKHACYNDTLDIACCIFSPQEQYKSKFKITSIPLDTSVPSVGDVVHMVSLDNMKIAGYSPATNTTGSGETFSISRRVSMRVGIVTAAYPQGFRNYRWPCFTTSIPAEPGMSGGFVYLPRDGQLIAACGIVSADCSTTEARANNIVCGESVIACAWPALALNVPVIAADNSPMRTLYDMMKAGDLPAATGGIDHIQRVGWGE